MILFQYYEQKNMKNQGGFRRNDTEKEQKK